MENQENLTQGEQVLTQTEQVAELLKKIAPDINSKNREQIHTDLGISHPTISKYLNGKVADVETGIGILQYCRGILIKRQQQIEAA